MKLHSVFQSVALLALLCSTSFTASNNSIRFASADEIDQADDAADGIFVPITLESLHPNVQLKPLKFSAGQTAGTPHQSASGAEAQAIVNSDDSEADRFSYSSFTGCPKYNFAASVMIGGQGVSQHNNAPAATTATTAHSTRESHALRGRRMLSMLQLN